MSVSQPKYKPMNDIIITTDSCKTPISLANLVDNVNNNNLHVFYPKEDSLFKKKIDKLNLKFYLETEKYLSNQHNERKCQEALFIILFQQISLYIEEIERLNLLIQEKKGDPKYIKERVEEYIQKQKNFETKELLIKTLKESKMNSEQRLAEMMSINEKIKIENESLKRQNQFYQDKLKLYLQNQSDSNNSQITDASSKLAKNINSNESLQQTQDGLNLNQSLKLSKIVNKKRNYSDNNPSNQNINAAKAVNRYTNNISNGNNLLENNGNKANNKLVKKKEFKIIKAVKEQLSGEINMKSDLLQSSRCKSPFLSKEEYNSIMTKFDNDLNELNTMEFFLKEFKKELAQESTSCFDYGLEYGLITNSPNNSKVNEHIKTEVMVSDLEDYEGYKSLPLQLPTNQETKKPSKNHNLVNHPKTTKQYPLLNSVTIDLNSSTMKEKELMENNMLSNGKVKLIGSNFRQLNSFAKKKKGI